MNGHFTLYAPNVHTGGGKVLLQGLLTARPDDARFPLTAYLNSRAKSHLSLGPGVDPIWVSPTLISRWRAELDLFRRGQIRDSVILCFHGIPPLLPTKAHIIVFQQNRLHLDGLSLSGFRWKTRLRIQLERWLSWILRHRVHGYIVQTPSMAVALKKWFGREGAYEGPRIDIFPFLEGMKAGANGQERNPSLDFVYVADGEAHKNHRRLFEAWRLLAEEGHHPSLGLTLSVRDGALIRELEAMVAKYGLAIRNLGQMEREDVMALYRRSRALIFPSTSESFGLPLIEAEQMGLPILASELDFVRDVCSPAQTFDPQSPVSIARAVKRHLGKADPALTLHSPQAFWEHLANLAFAHEDRAGAARDA